MKKSGRIFKDELTETWFIIGLVFAVFAVVGIIVFAISGDYLAFGGIPCGFQQVTHLYCPGCGGTRATWYLLHGRFIRSAYMHPFVPYYVADYLFFMVNTLLVTFTKKLGFSKYPVTITIYVGLGLLLVQWIVKNVVLIFFHIALI